MADFKASVAEVKMAYNIVEYIEQAGIRLRKTGSVYKGLCPFHNEKSPSFSVNENFQNYRCFGCGASGDILRFVQDHEHLEFFDALKKLAEDKNITLDLKEEKSGVDYTSLREAMRTVSNFFVSEYRKLPVEHPARNEVRKRGLSEKKMVYGYAPDNRRALYEHLKGKGFSDETILHTGACIQFEGRKEIFDFWHGRLMFFFTDITGKPLGWSGRKLYETDNRGKYVNSKDGVLFDKSAVLYNLANAKKMASETNRVYVNEGQFDVASLVEVGLLNSVAASGTAFTEKQGMILRRLVGEDGHIVFCFDGDKAGKAAAEKVFTRIPALHAQSYVVLLPDGHDPDTYRQENGDEALVRFLEENTKPLIEFVLEIAAEDFDLQDEMSKAKYLQRAASILRTVTSSILRETYTKRVSLDSFTSIEVVRDAVSRATPLRPDGPARAEEELPTPTVQEEEDQEEPTHLTAVKLRRMVGESEHYELSARLLALSFMDPQLLPVAVEVREHFPEDLAPLLEELSAYPVGEPLIPERFQASELVQELIMNDYYPFAHLMDEAARLAQAQHLARRLKTYRVSRGQAYVRSRVASVLQKSPTQGADFLEKALEQEERNLAKLGIPDSHTRGA